MSDPRENVAAFADQILGQPMWPHQVDAAKSGRFITTVAAARRTGKTTLAELLAIWTAFRERNVTVILLSATQEASRRLTESIAATLGAHALTRGAVVDDFATRIRLTNGSEIISLPASQRQVRGYGKGVRLVVLDEAGFMPSELWAAAHYTALDERPRSRILVTGTPWGGTDHFFRRAFRAGLDGDPDHATFHWTYEANPKLDRAYLERQRDRVSPAEYAAEILGEWSDAVGSLFPRELLEARTADIELPAFDALRPKARGIVGVDWGASYDRSAVAGVFRVPIGPLNDEQRPVFTVLPHVWAAKTPLSEVVNDVAAQACQHFAYVCPELNGIGQMPAQELQVRVRQRANSKKIVWNPRDTTAGTKTAGYGCVMALLERKQLILPRDPDLLRQLAGLRFEQGERGFTRISAENDAVHDDVADALMLAALPHKPRGRGRVVCHLAMLAAGPNAPADAPLPQAFEEPVVSTGDGQQIWRRPPLQSVADLGLTLPIQNDQREPARVGSLSIRRFR